MAKYVDRMNRPVTLALFKEFARPHAKFKPIYTLAQWREVYLKHCDPTEYAPAMELLEDWDHWLMVREHPFIKPHIEKWRIEAEVKLRSQAVRHMIKHAQGQNGTAAAKWLAEGAYNKQNPKTKEEKQKEEIIQKEVDDRVTADVARLGLRAVK
jgi:hypothetical protein